MVYMRHTIETAPNVVILDASHARRGLQFPGSPKPSSRRRLPWAVFRCARQRDRRIWMTTTINLP